MSTRGLYVYLDGTLCGHLEQTPSGNLTFKYDDSYRSGPNPTPLSLSMPLAVMVHKKRAVLRFLQGLLPDSEEALRAIGRRFSVSPSNPFAMLQHIGSDVAGAIQICGPDGGPTDGVLQQHDVRPVAESDVAMMLDHAVSEYADGTPYDDGAGRFSVAGAQPKIALHKMADGGWGVPNDATPTTHILKPATGPFSRLDVVEQMTMHAASVLGNDVAKSEIVSIGKWDVFVTERYDRAVVDGTWRRLHQEDLCQALSVPPEKKYQHRDRGPGAAEIAQLLRSLPMDSDRRVTGEKFYRAFVFNVVAGCTDAHAKNYSLLLHGNNVTLAPLYDLATYAPYWNGTSRIDSAMNVDGEYSLERISRSNLAGVGIKFGLSIDQATEIVTDVSSRMVQAFESARAQLEAQGPQAREVADDVLGGLVKLPLVDS